MNIKKGTKTNLECDHIFEFIFILLSKFPKIVSKSRYNKLYSQILITTIVTINIAASCAQNRKTEQN